MFFNLLNNIFLDVHVEIQNFEDKGKFGLLNFIERFAEWFIDPDFGHSLKQLSGCSFVKFAAKNPLSASLGRSMVLMKLVD